MPHSSPAFLRALLRALLTSLVLALAGCAGTNESPGEYIDDVALTARVKAAFVADRVVSALNIRVDSAKGHVHLSGVARNSEEMRQAEAVARQVRGVRSVRNDIVLR
jgi:hyperosmotically inducible protein